MKCGCYFLRLYVSDPYGEPGLSSSIILLAGFPQIFLFLFHSLSIETLYHFTRSGLAVGLFHLVPYTALQVSCVQGVSMAFLMP